MKVVGFAGPAGSGKDTAGAVLIRAGWTRVSFAAPLKRALHAMGFPEPPTQAQKEEIIPWLGRSWRYLAQTLGTEWGRKLVDDDLWVKAALRSLDPEGCYVFTDVRFENEAKAIRAVGGLIAHLHGRKATLLEGTAGHISEAGIACVSGDCVINNGELTLDGLEAKVLAMVSNFA